LVNMERRPPPVEPKPYAKAGVLLDGTEPAPPVLECAFGDWFAIARGAHDPPAACRLRPRDWFFNRLLQRCALRLVATQPRGDGNGGLLRRRVTLRTIGCSRKLRKGVTTPWPFR